MGHLTLCGTRCIVPPLPRPTALDLVVAAMAAGVDAAAGMISGIYLSGVKYVPFAFIRSCAQKIIGLRFKFV